MIIHVAAAVIEDGLGNIFLAKRPDDKHQGGLWEFPGGKVESGESPTTALIRELDEEVGIQVTESHPLIQVPYHYADKSVFLDVFRVTAFTGTAWGKEGQEACWVPVNELDSYSFPAANKPILNAVLLPEKVLITPACESLSECLEGIKVAMGKHDLTWVMLRQKQLSDEDYCHWAVAISADIKAAIKDHVSKSALLTLNCSVELANRLNADGLHLTSARLMSLTCREEFTGRFLGASCHSLEELNQAAALKCDYVTLSPVNATGSHPETPAIGWLETEKLISETALPVLLLGGMHADDLSRAFNIGAHGIAAINAWWT
ncbi:Nudix family hydrolase [Neptunomonas qingdaonensis]|uniref:8-oxo-dGTP diphosphatase n=1 Tax=Neptunomonas qingdaonensis TaxID=1045558 RepID=A0A1I2TGH3_9GAMM|nr:Nudix family hydrolase [Neptunomonas qingdaonensis]SFG63998.1 8-oxo-dGTP diphosphatase [Neptunomonas qingdaonensis]